MHDQSICSRSPRKAAGALANWTQQHSLHTPCDMLLFGDPAINTTLQACKHPMIFALTEEFYSMRFFFCVWQVFAALRHCYLPRGPHNLLYKSYPSSLFATSHSLAISSIKKASLNLCCNFPNALTFIESVLPLKQLFPTPHLGVISNRV